MYESVKIVVLILAVVALLPSCGGGDHAVTRERLDCFERSLERFQRDLQIPGMAAAIVEGGEVRWSKGFGYADIENGIPATPHTPFQLCSVTKAIAAVVIHQLVEEGQFDLTPPLRDYGIDLDDSGTVRLLHLITHTSQGIPGSSYRYHGDRYGYLGAGIKGQTGRSFRTHLIERVIDPLGMDDTAPNPVDPEVLERFLDFARENGLDTRIGFSGGERFHPGDLFDYDDGLYDPTINAAMSLLADYFDSKGIKKGEFMRYVEGKTDPALLEGFTGYQDKEGRFNELYSRLARPYKLDQSGNVVTGQYSMFFNPAAGLNSSVLDLASFDIALDSGAFISEETRERAFTPFRLAGGEESPYGLGWFSEEYDGIRLVWHGGEWHCASALYLKIPEKGLTLVIAANSRAMSQAFAMGAGTVLNSGIGLEFLRLFVYGPEAGIDMPEIDWASPPEEYGPALARIGDSPLSDLYAKILRVMENMYIATGKVETAKRLFREAHPALLPESVTGRYDGIETIAGLIEVGDDFDGRSSFTLDEETAIRIYAVGEIDENGAYDRGWIEDAATGKVVWAMKLEETGHAGGAERNRLSDLALSLPAGSYTLRYVSDNTHSYMGWYGAAPDHLFWGIEVRPEGDVR